MKKSKVVLAIAVVTLGVSAANVRAQDPVSVCPNNFKVLAEDDTTRVLHFTQKKGETCGMHSHPYLVGYTLKSNVRGGTISLHQLNRATRLTRSCQACRGQEIGNANVPLVEQRLHR